jgi:two-component system phosphate regulon sensor histidine kinase PhoR
MTMARTFIKISLVLLIIVALPMGFYLVREYSALSKNEQMVERVFSTQLESILFAVNQYSENVLKQWSQTLDQPVEADGELMHSLVDNLFQNNQALRGVRFLDLDRHQVMAELIRPGDIVRFRGWPDPETVRNMRELLKNKYQQLHPEPAGDHVIYCFLPSGSEGKVCCQFVVNLKAFVDQNLRPQIQKISQEIFYIRIYNKQSRGIVYATDATAEADSTLQKAAMWYLPDHELGIRLKSKTIYELASERTQRDNYLLIGMGLLVLLGFLFVVVNIRRQIRLAEMKSEFVSNVSHEIRTPLALISMYAETLLLKRLKAEEKQQEYLKSIHRESMRLADIVNRILDFSRMEKNRRIYRFEELNLNEYIPHIIRSVGSHLENGHMNCRFVPEKDDLTIMADPEAFKDVLVNLIDNAIKYNDSAEPKIEIRLLQRQGQIVVEVEDNGIGISVRHQKYIFDQFYRVTEGDLAHKAKGSGLGLNLVRRIMKEHGGTVSVRSKLGEGSTFILKFPVKSS